MGTDKTDSLKTKNQVSLLSVLVVKFDEGLEKVSSSMSAALPLWSKFLQFPSPPIIRVGRAIRGQNSSKTPNPALIPARSVPPIKVILGQDGDNFRAFTEESPTRTTESFSFRVTE